MNEVMQCFLQGRPWRWAGLKWPRDHRTMCPVGSLQQHCSRAPTRRKSDLPHAVQVAASSADEDTFAFDVLISDDPEVLAQAITRLRLDNERMREELQAAVKALEAVSPAASVLWAKEAAFHLEGLTADDLAQGKGHFCPGKKICDRRFFTLALLCGVRP
jgi:hypothetical protein